MEELEIIKFYLIDIIILMIPVLYIVIATLKSINTKSVITYGSIISVVTSIIIQSRYPAHPHVPGSGVFFALVVLLICFFVMAISLILRKYAKNTKNT